jgi:hypothetical protein
MGFTASCLLLFASVGMAQVEYTISTLAAGERAHLWEPWSIAIDPSGDIVAVDAQGNIYISDQLIIEFAKSRLTGPSTRYATVHRRNIRAYGTIGVPVGKSPGGREENTGNASALSDKLMIGTGDVIFTNPVKFVCPTHVPTFDDPCANGPSVTKWLPVRAPDVV